MLLSLNRAWMLSCSWNTDWSDSPWGFADRYNHVVIISILHNSSFPISELWRFKNTWKRNIPSGPKKTEQLIQSIFQDFALINNKKSASFPHYNNTKIIKFGWELFILWVISYGLSFSGFARFPEFRGRINDKSMANPENESPWVSTHKIKSSQPNLMILVLL